MNRVIKFRAFNKVSEIMYYPEATPGNYNHYIQVGTEGFWLYSKDGQLICTSDRGDILMQYTGLNDKNGKEIYEGDVLKHTKQIDGNFIDRLFERYEVAYNSSIASFEYRPIDGKEYKQYTIRPFGGDEIEIIGNIFKVNPPADSPAHHTMFDPNTQQQEAAEQAAPTIEQVAAVEQDAQEKAMESAEEGTTEG